MKPFKPCEPVKITILVILGMILFVMVVGLACTLPTSSEEQKPTQINTDESAMDLKLTQTQFAMERTQQAAHQVQAIPATPASQQVILVTENATWTAVAVTRNPQPSQTPSLEQTNLALPGFSNFTDNFLDSNSGWPEQKSGSNQWWYAADHYHIMVGSSDTQIVIPSGYTLADGYIITNATIPEQTDPPKSFLGVVCRYQDANNYYFFEISRDGYYRIGKMWNGEQALIGMTAAKYSKAINSNGYNQLMAECRDNELTLYVNDTFIETVYDNTFNFGQVGLCASTGGFPGVIAAFENIIAEE